MTSRIAERLQAFQEPPCAVIAHRGGRQGAPENTIAAFDSGLNQGAHGIELDVRLSADNEVMVIHDATVDRTTNGTGRVRNQTQAELQQLDAGYSFTDTTGRHSYRGQGITIPTLREVFARYPAIPLIVEMKAERTTDLAEAMARLINDTGRRDHLIVASFDRKLLQQFRTHETGVPTNMALVETAWFYGAHLVGAHEHIHCPGDAFQVPRRYYGIPVVQQRFVQAAHACNMPVHVWTVNERAVMQHLCAIGVDALITDVPHRALRVIDAL